MRTINYFNGIMLILTIFVLIIQVIACNKVMDENRRLMIENASMKQTLAGNGYYYISQEQFERNLKGNKKVVILR